ncbi:ABC transporter permease [Spelaeicoccus albus]|uniref:Teichoic acid transport system permease protein n=1 Tax=Spelaeicoccus albus TaxID=1280376 RepID=A0A7Z0D170_9MICO|nr:ABC transporter permease [Spelaeicoccus albus]NYI66458.1 teichoic acid transport system permease protein [Spelaeicoccus albus]
MSSTDPKTWHPSVTVDVAGLQPIGRRPSLPTYIRRLWQRRFFIYAEARSKLLSSTRQNILGNAWLILDPIISGAVYFVIFGLVLHTSRGIDDFIGYLVIGVFLFKYTTRCLTSGAGSIRSNRAMIKAFSFPRASIPITVIMREVLNLVPIVIAMLLIILIASPREEITWRWALLIPILAIQTVFNLGIALFAARLASMIPDVEQLLKYLSRFWLYASAVFFSYDRFEGHPLILAATDLNPAFNFLDMTRDSLLYATTPHLSSWLLTSGWALGMAIVGFVFFWQGEESYARD